MSAAQAQKSNWIKQNYDKLLLVLLLTALLASALYLLWRIRGERSEIEEGKWQNPARPIAAEILDLTPYMASNAPLTEPFKGKSATTNLLLASELRVMCVNDDCAKPIPFEALVCPFCKESQPDPDTPLDSDDDKIPDKKEIELGMNPYDPNDASEDLDGDGFTNLEEHLSSSDARDPTSTPPPGAKLRLLRADSTPFPLIFVGALGQAENRKFQLNSRVEDRTYFSRLNEEVTGYKVVEYIEDAKEGPTLILEKGESRMELVRDRKAQSQDWIADIISLLDGERFSSLRIESQLQVKGFGYIVVDIQRHKVVLKDANSGEEITVPRITRLEVEELKALLRGEQTRGGVMDPGMGLEGRPVGIRPRR